MTAHGSKATEADPGTCSSCGAAVLWVRTQAGKAMPLDAAPTLDGNVAMLEGGASRAYGLEDHAAQAKRYTSHFATCPHADQWRKR